MTKYPYSPQLLRWFPKPLKHIPQPNSRCRTQCARLTSGIIQVYVSEAVVEGQGEAAGGRIVDVLLVQQAGGEHRGHVEGGVAHAQVYQAAGGEAQGAAVAHRGDVLGAGEEVEQVEGAVNAQAAVAGGVALELQAGGAADAFAVAHGAQAEAPGVGVHRFIIVGVAHLRDERHGKVALGGRYPGEGGLGGRGLRRGGQTDYYCQQYSAHAL